MTEGERFFESIVFFTQTDYPRKFGRDITVECIGTADMDRREEILQGALEDGLSIDDYIALKKIWIDE